MAELIQLKKLSRVLESRRKELDKSRKEVASAAHISEPYLWSLERAVNKKTGKPSRPSADVLRRLARVLDLDQSVLFPLAGYPVAGTGDAAAEPASGYELREDLSSLAFDIAALRRSVDQLASRCESLEATLASAVGQLGGLRGGAGIVPWQWLDEAEFTHLCENVTALEETRSRAHWVVSGPPIDPPSPPLVYSLHRPRQNLDPPDLAGIEEWLHKTQHVARDRLVLTSGALTKAGSRHLREVIERFRGQDSSLSVGYLDGRALADLLQGHPGVREQYFPSDDPRAEHYLFQRRLFFEDAADIWAGKATQRDKLTRLQRSLAKHREAQPECFGEQDALIYLQQRIELRYLSDRTERVTLRFVVANIGQNVVESDRFNFAHELPVADAADLSFVATDENQVPLAHRFLWDQPTVRIVECDFPGGLSPLDVYGYAASFVWPYPGELHEEPRWHDCTIHRFTAALSIKATVPSEYAVEDVAFRQRGRESAQVTASVAEDPHEGIWTLEGAQDLPPVGSVYRLSFTAKEPEGPAARVERSAARSVR